MINGTYAMLYSDDAEATRAALAKVLGTQSVDARGWLIFALPSAEIAVHPAERGDRAEFHLLHDDVAATASALEAKGIVVARPVSDQGLACGWWSGAWRNRRRKWASDLPCTVGDRLRAATEGGL